MSGNGKSVSSGLFPDVFQAVNQASTRGEGAQHNGHGFHARELCARDPRAQAPGKTGSGKTYVL